MYRRPINRKSAFTRKGRLKHDKVILKRIKTTEDKDKIEKKRPKNIPTPWADLSDLHNIHHNKNAFIVGAGCSVGDLNLSPIFSNNDNIVLCVNSAILLMPWTENEAGVLKRFWVSTDSLTMAWDYFWNKVVRSSCTRIVRDSWRKYDNKLKRHGFRYFRIRKSYSNPTANDGGLMGQSSVLAAIDLTLWMGCKKIFLLGVDHYMVNGKSHFWQNWPKKQMPKRKDREAGYTAPHKQQNSVFKTNMIAFNNLNRLSKEVGATIFNCSQNSKVDVFQKISLDQAVLMSLNAE